VRTKVSAARLGDPLSATALTLATNGEHYFQLTWKK
jgi:hypothetical protein